MVRWLTLILIVAGLVVFFGNVTGLYPTIPGLGVGAVILGCCVLFVLKQVDLLWAGADDWRFNE